MHLLTKRSVLESFERVKTSRLSEFRQGMPTWCPGCGHYSPLQGLYESLTRLKIQKKDFVLVSGIGCSSRMPFFVEGYGLHGLHGRALPIATGVKLANPALTVVVAGGDGDGIGIGGGHLPHVARYNFDLTYLLMDNSIYGLTKGQTSPTSPMGMVSGTSPYGNFAQPLNPAFLALAYGATFVARAFSAERDLVTDLIVKAMQHRGFSIIHLVSPCVEFNRKVTYDEVRSRVKRLPDDYQPNHRMRALEMAGSEDPIYEGLLFQEDRPSFEDNRKASLKKIKPA